MAMFKGGTGGIFSEMIGNVAVVNYRNGKVVLRSAPGMTFRTIDRFELSNSKYAGAVTVA